MSRRPTAYLLFALFVASAAQLPAGAAIGTAISNGEVRVSQHAYRFGAPQGRSDVSSSYIVWQDHRGTSVDPRGNAIWSKDLTTRDEAPVTILSTRAAPPRISGARVVWADIGTGGDMDIFTRVLPGGATTAVTTASGDQMNPVIDGTLVAWEDYRGGDTSDIWKKDVATADPESPVVTAAGNQGGISISGNTIAWRDARRGGATFEDASADVYIRTGTDPEVEVKQAGGFVGSVDEQNNVPGHVMVAIDGTRLLWNEIDPACPDIPEAIPQCESPKLLKTCVLPCSAVTLVDSVTSVDDGDFQIVGRLDLSGSRAVWYKTSPSSGPDCCGFHVFTKDLATADAPAQVDPHSGPNGGAGLDPRVNGSTVVWTDFGEHPGAESEDIFWDDVGNGDPPRRANSIGLGAFGENVLPVADGNVVAYKAPGATGGPPTWQTWATELTTPRRYVRVTSVSGTGTARPAISGNRVAWHDPRNCPNADGLGCINSPYPFDVFQRAPFDSGPEVQLSSPNFSGSPPDADGNLTAWDGCLVSCTEEHTIYVHDGLTLHSFDVSGFLFDPASVLSSPVRISGNRVAWHEYFFGGPNPGDSEARIHVLHVTLDSENPNNDTAVDEVVGWGLDTQVDDAADLDISGTTVVWNGAGKVWKNTATAVGCGGDPPCDHSGSATVFESAPECSPNQCGLHSVSIDGTRVAWVSQDDLVGTDVFTRTTDEPDSHLVTNETTAFVQFPVVDGDNIFWQQSGDAGGSDIYWESVSGPTGSGPDTTAPSAPTGFTATKSGSQVDLSWTNPSTPDFARVRILRRSGGSPAALDDPTASVVYEGSGTSFTDTDIDPALDYAYTAFAYDFEPNFSAAATATTSVGGGGGASPSATPVQTPSAEPSPEPTPAPEPSPSVSQDPEGDPLSSSECDPATQACGTTGNDSASASDGSVATGSGNDDVTITTNENTESVDVDTGADADTVDASVTPGSGDQQDITINSGEGADVINLDLNAGGGADQDIALNGGGGADQITVDVAPDAENATIEINAGDGDDDVVVNVPEDATNIEIIIISEDGDDNVDMSEIGDFGGSITVVTGSGEDALSMPPSPGTVRIVVRLGAGNDTVKIASTSASSTAARGARLAQAGASSTGGGFDIDAGYGADEVAGSRGRDDLRGGPGNDSMGGGRGGDELRGGTGHDRLNGGRGADLLFGGRGNDRLDGGPDQDSCAQGRGRGELLRCE